jgi:hypothetical protein
VTSYRPLAFHGSINLAQRPSMSPPGTPMRKIKLNTSNFRPTWGGGGSKKKKTVIVHSTEVSRRSSNCVLFIVVFLSALFDGPLINRIFVLSLFLNYATTGYQSTYSSLRRLQRVAQKDSRVQSILPRSYVYTCRLQWCLLHPLPRVGYTVRYLESCSNL